VVVLDADVSKATRTNLFAGEFPDRFIDCGCAEANMINVAAGISLSGFIPFATAMATFASLRALGQGRNTVCYPRLKVNIVATHGGITVGEDGPTHQSVEDIAVMRSIPNMTVVVPADAPQTRKAVFAASEYPGPVYIRLGRPPVPVVTTEDLPFEIGKAQVLKEGEDITLIACGLMVDKALHASERLKGGGILAGVVNIHSVKPVDEEIVLDAAKKTGGIVKAEEASIIGGLGSAVLEVLSKHSLFIPVKRWVSRTRLLNLEALKNF
jgi:transketolase